MIKNKMSKASVKMAHVSFPKSPDSWGTGAGHRNHCNIGLEAKIMQGGLFSSKISYNHCIKNLHMGWGPDWLL